MLLTCKMEQTDTFNNMDESQKHHVLRKKIETEEYALCDSIIINFMNKQNQFGWKKSVVASGGARKG